ncbi:MAG: hypothetical protein H0Z32_04760 [Bacillaceae bacterium]|nr:hypothetical protein [Bacillaceae bacterium]
MKKLLALMVLPVIIASLPFYLVSDHSKHEYTPIMFTVDNLEQTGKDDPAPVEQDKNLKSLLGITLVLGILTLFNTGIIQKNYEPISRLLMKLSPVFYQSNYLIIHKPLIR